MNKSLTSHCDALNHAIMETWISKTEKYVEYERLFRPILNTLSDVSSSRRITAITYDKMFDLLESIRVDFPNDMLLQRVRIAIRTFLDSVCESVEFDIDSIRLDVYLWALKIALELGCLSLVDLSEKLTGLMEIGIDNEIFYDLHLSQSKEINEAIVVISRHLSNKQIVDKEYHQLLVKNVVIGFLKTLLDSGRIDKQTFCGHVNGLATYYHLDPVLSNCGDYQDINDCLYQQTIDRVLQRAAYLFDCPALR